MIINSRGLNNNQAARSSLLDWVIDGVKPHAKAENNSLVLDPTTAGSLGIDYNASQLRKGIQLHAPSLQLQLNRQNSREKSEVYQTVLAIVINEMFLRELMMLNQIRFQKLRDAYDEFFKRDKKEDRSDFGAAARLRLDEEVRDIDAKNAANLAKASKIDTTESSFVARLKEHMEEKEEWLAQAEQENNGWLDRILPPPTTAEDRAFRESFQANVARENAMRRQNAEGLSRLRIQTEELIKTAPPAKKAKLTEILKDVKELEEEQKASTVRSRPKNLEKNVFVHLDQLSDYQKNVEYQDRNAQRGAMSSEEGEKFDAEYKAWFSDVNRQTAVKNQMNRAENIKMLNTEFQKSKVRKMAELITAAETNLNIKEGAVRTHPPVATNRAGIWVERAKADDQKEKTKLIYKVQMALNDAEERTRQEDKVDSPAVSKYLNSVYHHIDDEERKLDEVLEKVKEQLDTMQKDTDVPDRMRAVAKNCSAQISALSKRAEVVEKTESAPPVATNGKREELKELNFESKKPSKAPDEVNDMHPATEEQLDSLNMAEELFEDIKQDRSVKPNVKNDLNALQVAVQNYRDNQSMKSAVTVKDCFQKIDWAALETNPKADELKSMIETDGFIDQIHSATNLDQDLDASSRPSKSF